MRYGFGLLPSLSAVVGILVCVRRQEASDLVLLSWAAIFYIIIGPGQTVFFRYALPLFPVATILAAIALRQVTDYVSAKTTSIVLAIVVTAVAAEPVCASVRLVTLMGREDTRVLARKWIESNVPEGQTVANLGGTFGEVQIRDINSEGWWISAYYQSFTPEEKDLADFVEERIRDNRPLYQTTNYFRAVRSGSDPKPFPSLVITHEHPLPYSDVTADQVQALEATWSLLAEFAPGPARSLDAFYDREDAFYLPMSGFGGLERSGPVIKIWGKGKWYTSDLRSTIATRFGRCSVWRGNAYRKGGRLDLAELSYARALAFDNNLADAALQFISLLCVTDKFELAFNVVDFYLLPDAPFTQIAEAVLSGRETEGKSYHDVSRLAAHLGRGNDKQTYTQKARDMGFHEK